MILSDAAYVDAKCKKEVHMGHISWRQMTIVVIKSSKMPINHGLFEYGKYASVCIIKDDPIRNNVLF